ILERQRYSPRQVERLDALGYTWAVELMEVPTGLPAPSKEAMGLDTADALAWLDEYADRSEWDGVEEEASERLETVRMEQSPWPMVVGEAGFKNRMASPAWALLAFAAPVGYATLGPFGIALRNTSASPIAAHVLVCAPDSGIVAEAFQRANDHVWLERQ